MSAVRSKNTRPEMTVRRAAHGLGLRFRLHRKDLPGKPDLVFPKWKTVLFVHGCFWHRHPGCAKASIPKSNTEFWLEKFDKNVRRDEKARQELAKLKWRVVVLWQCEVKTLDMTQERLRSVFGIEDFQNPRRHSYPEIPITSPISCADVG